MRTELLFESCPFLTSANVTLSRLGFADGDALWEIMQDEEHFIRFTISIISNIKC